VADANAARFCAAPALPAQLSGIQCHCLTLRKQATMSLGRIEARCPPWRTRTGRFLHITSDSILRSRQWAPMITHYGEIMSIPRFLPAADFEKFKQAARHLKRDSEITHHDALEQTALANGFQNWNQAAQLAKETQPSEAAYRSGFVLAFDIKDALDNSNLPNELFHIDHFAADFAEPELFDCYLLGNDDEEDDEDEDPKSHCDKWSEDELKEIFYESFFGTLFFYRFAGSNLPKTVQEAMKLASKSSFFPPHYVWFRGKFIKVFEDLSVDGRLDW
jgi:hypothetical protein